MTDMFSLVQCIFKTKNLKKTDSNICSNLRVVRQLFLCDPLPPSPVSVRQNMSKCFFAQIP